MTSPDSPQYSQHSGADDQAQTLLRLGSGEVKTPDASLFGLTVPAGQASRFIPLPAGLDLERW